MIVVGSGTSVVGASSVDWEGAEGAGAGVGATGGGEAGVGSRAGSGVGAVS